MPFRALALSATALGLFVIPTAASAGSKASGSVVSLTSGDRPGKAAKPVPPGLLRALETANANGRKGILRGIRNRSRGC